MSSRYGSRAAVHQQAVNAILGAEVHMSKHTPGPWRLQDGYLISYVVNDDGRSLARIVWGTEPFVGETEEAKANGRLMAASPRMLSALKYAEASISLLCAHAGRDAEVAQFLLPIRAAMAEAETA